MLLASKKYPVTWPGQLFIVGRVPPAAFGALMVVKFPSVPRSNP
jgi:hypothetical protein